MIRALTAAEMGAAAFRDGLTLRDNPFRKQIRGPFRKKWADGWKAAKAAQRMPLTAQEQEARELWRAYCRSGRKPADIPENPDEVYAAEWISWTDWIGGFKTEIN